jgi:AraC family transcriptional regulator
MEPNIIKQGELIIVGMVYYGNPFWDAEAGAAENEIGKLWTRFNAYYEGNREAFKQEVDRKVGWELHIGTDEYEETKEYFVMVGVQVAEIEDLPAPVFAKVLPAGAYAVFTLEGEEMTANWSDAIYKEWLPSSAYEEAYSCTIERYDGDRFKGWGDPESEVEIWVPVMPTFRTDPLEG